MLRKRKVPKRDGFVGGSIDAMLDDVMTTSHGHDEEIEGLSRGVLANSRVTTREFL